MTDEAMRERARAWLVTKGPDWLTDEEYSSEELGALLTEVDTEARREALFEAADIGRARIDECKHDRADAVSYEDEDNTKSLNGCSRCWEAAEISAAILALGTDTGGGE